MVKRKSILISFISLVMICTAPPWHSLAQSDLPASSPEPLAPQNQVPRRNADFNKMLAAHWAPVIYHQTHPLDPRGDWMTRFDFDGDQDAWNNWENMSHYPLPGYLYYGVSETETHYFIYYGVFHPRDWEPGIDNGISSHENDLEDILLVVRKNETRFGQFELIETQAHSDFLAYAPHQLKSRHMQQAGKIHFEGHRPLLYIPTGGHGIYGLEGVPHEKGIIYAYTGKAQEPTGLLGVYEERVGYDLISIDALWQQRDQRGKGTPFTGFGIFGADDYTWVNSAVAPWRHDDSNDGPGQLGDAFSDPAYLIETHFDLSKPYSRHYLQPPFYTHRLALHSVSQTKIFSGYIEAEVWVDNHLYWRVPYQLKNVRYHPQTTAWRYLTLPLGGNILVRWYRVTNGFLGHRQFMGARRYLDPVESSWHGMPVTFERNPEL